MKTNKPKRFLIWFFPITILSVLFLYVLAPRIIIEWKKSSTISCYRNLIQISSALHEYHQDFGCFPPVYVKGNDGIPMHSWRVLILPYIGEEALYSKYDFKEAWNGPNNRKLLDEIPEIYQCPADYSIAKCETSYVSVLRKGTAWPGDKGISRSVFGDDLSNTIMIVEVVDSGIQWLEPCDMSLNEISENTSKEGVIRIGSRHIEDLPYCIWADGRCTRIDLDVKGEWGCPAEGRRQKRGYH